jgi:superoxide dismutase
VLLRYVTRYPLPVDRCYGHGNRSLSILSATQNLFLPFLHVYLNHRLADLSRVAHQSAIDRNFGSFKALQNQISIALAGIQGSGWAWLVKDKTTGTLQVATRANQDPVSGPFIPLLGIDAWEHAYYLQYQNRKAEYFSAIWNVINWKTVARRLEKA